MSRTSTAMQEKKKSSVSQGICSAQRGSTFWPKVVACGHVGRFSLGAAYDLQLFVCAASDSGVTYVDGCRGSLATLLSLDTLLTTSGRVFTITLFLKLSTPLFSSSPSFHRRGGLSGTSLWHIGPSSCARQFSEVNPQALASHRQKW